MDDLKYLEEAALHWTDSINKCIDLAVQIGPNGSHEQMIHLDKAIGVAGRALDSLIALECQQSKQKPSLEEVSIAKAKLIAQAVDYLLPGSPDTQRFEIISLLMLAITMNSQLSRKDLN